MLDIQLFKTDRVATEQALAKRMEATAVTQTIDTILELDDKRRTIIAEVEELKAERNVHSKNKPTSEIIEQMKKVGEEIKKLDKQLNTVETQLHEQLAELPNIPADDVVAGDKEANKVLKTFGTKPVFDFEPKDHVELATQHGLIDYERAAKMSGAGFWVYIGRGAELEWALLQYFIDYHRTHGYTFMIPPYLLNEASAFASGHLPKFKDDLFWTQDDTCLNATSEMMLTNYHRDEILEEKELPKKYYAYSTCFRREAGSYRKEERGMIRGHQFNKIEMFHFTKPEDSWSSFDELTKAAEELTDGLGLHFQTSLLAAGDASAAMAKTIDIEVWIPSMGIFKEVSSVSNATDYQARRGNIRYKDVKTKKNAFVHTLNGSGLATSRLLPAILEQNQQADGSIVVPKVLQQYCGFDVIN